MKFLIIVAFLLMASVAFAWDNPCYRGMVTDKTLPRMASSMVTLEAGRVGTVEGNIFTYDLGKEAVIIKAEGFGARAFLKRLQDKKCEKGELVTLIPKEKNSQNKVFTAIPPRL